MIDATVVIQDFLAQQTALTNLVGARLWGDMGNPPPGYLPSQGQALVFRPRGSQGPDYSGQIIKPSYMFKAYGETPEKARQLYRTLFDVMQGRATGGVWNMELEIGGTPLEEPATGWPYYLSFWTATMKVYFVAP